MWYLARREHGGILDVWFVEEEMRLKGTSAYGGRKESPGVVRNWIAQQKAVWIVECGAVNVGYDFSFFALQLSVS